MTGGADAFFVPVSIKAGLVGAVGATGFGAGVTLTVDGEFVIRGATAVVDDVAPAVGALGVTVVGAAIVDCGALAEGKLGAAVVDGGALAEGKLGAAVVDGGALAEGELGAAVVDGGALASAGLALVDKLVVSIGGI